MSQANVLAAGNVLRVQVEDMDAYVQTHVFGGRKSHRRAARRERTAAIRWAQWRADCALGALRQRVEGDGAIEL